MAVAVEYEEKGGKVEMDKEDFENLLATVETLENEEVVKQLSASQKDKEADNVFKWSRVKDNIGI